MRLEFPPSRHLVLVAHVAPDAVVRHTDCAIFADEVAPRENGVDLINVDNQVSIVPLTLEHASSITHRMTLFVQVTPHTLSFIHEGDEYLPPSDFALLPKHGNIFTIGVERDFLMEFTEEPKIHVYPVYLELVPLLCKSVDLIDGSFFGLHWYPDRGVGG